MSWIGSILKRYGSGTLYSAGSPNFICRFIKHKQHGFSLMLPNLGPKRLRPVYECVCVYSLTNFSTGNDVIIFDCASVHMKSLMAACVCVCACLHFHLPLSFVLRTCLCVWGSYDQPKPKKRPLFDRNATGDCLSLLLWCQHQSIWIFMCESSSNVSLVKVFKLK